MVAALDLALSATPEERRRVATAARELVLRRHALDDYAQACAGLFAEVMMRDAT